MFTWRNPGRWHYRDDDDDRTLRFEPGDGDGEARQAVLSVTSCEDSNPLLVLRRVAVAFANLPARTLQRRMERLGVRRADDEAVTRIAASF